MIIAVNVKGSATYATGTGETNRFRSVAQGRRRRSSPFEALRGTQGCMTRVQNIKRASPSIGVADNRGVCLSVADTAERTPNMTCTRIYLRHIDCIDVNSLLSFQNYLHLVYVARRLCRRGKDVCTGCKRIDQDGEPRLGHVRLLWKAVAILVRMKLRQTQHAPSEFPPNRP